MSVKIRLTKTGKKKQITFRIVATDTRTKRDGKFLENLGFYYPFGENNEHFKIDMEKYNAWLAKGARPTLAVTKLIEDYSSKEKSSKSAK